MDTTEPGAAPETGPQVETPAAESKTPSPSRKRPRDFAADLKGLTPSGDEGDGGHIDSSPRTKKQRVGQGDSDDEAQSVDDGEVSESNDDDDGEISESDDDDDGASSRHSEASRSSRPRKMSPRNAEKPSGTPAPVTTNGYNPGISLGVRTSFAGRTAANTAPAKSTPLFASARSRSASPEASEQSEEGEAEEGEEADDGDQEGPSAGASEGTISTPASNQAKSPAGAASAAAPATFKSGAITWTVPATAPFSIPKNSALRKPAGWRSVLDIWITAFLKENMEYAEGVNKQVLVLGLNSYINTNVGKQKGAKNSVTKARSAVTKMWAGIDQKALDKLVAECKQDAQRELDEEGSSSSESGGDSDNEADQEDGEVFDLDTDEELTQQQLYYPGAADPSQYCLSCSGIGHKAKECPQRSCRFCSSFKHTSYGCPTKRRCSRCYALGHSSKSCTEKLALTAEERDPCAFCGAPHLEAECSEIWRSYNPGAVTRRTVKTIPTFCFTCGRQGHYGPECGLPGRGPKIAGPTTWSQANRDLYIDPASDAVAIGWANVDSASASAVPSAFHIRGHAGPRRTHTHFVSSDDSDDGFIQEPIRNTNNARSQQRTQGRSGAGSIRISSNIASGGPPRNAAQSQRRRDEREFSPPPPLPPGGGGGGGGFSALSSRNGGNNRAAGADAGAGAGAGGNNGGNWQPPLPSGPPPPMPSGYASLPPRPNARSSHRGGGNGGGGGGGSRAHGGGAPPSRPRGGGGQRSQNRGRGGGGGGGGGRGRGGRR
ncbi:uncharacterized protein B0I36DRAFT_330291 [Microdochium trichocladiopsis]|uniref:CCHC-type domain-containing protein n=1 Tax=Microdochium trichocladiopsis TaxID=1682393 RepID=A0A9P8Y2C7_9PEZI|nr:uncharacterized protein B0I36DRAFT_330291 [Microdochium trichocladiopsis]KAH7026279.1 hypothetical protein B0I36DRAFT_330291 [Microdochium trichocladiopsis]